MYRRNEKKGGSNRRFKQRAGKTDRLNLVANRRGGTRL